MLTRNLNEENKKFGQRGGAGDLIHCYGEKSYGGEIAPFRTHRKKQQAETVVQK